MKLLDYEKKHIDFLEKNSAECCLFLKRNNEFPLKKIGNLVLLGNGARNTIKGGTGSGDVYSRFYSNCEQSLKEVGFNIVSTMWLNQYDQFKKTTKKEHIKEVKKLAKKNKTPAFIYSMGLFEEEKNYDIPIPYEGEACIYVLARNSGEGNDRRNIKGDVLLSDKEVEDILYLNKKFKKFMLVLNVGGVIDLSPVLEVSNILLLSQLGVVTGKILANIILGKYNPSGKLSTTWAKCSDYPFFNEFGNRDDTYYKEGLYVGYRYFTSFKKKSMFPFGYGLSYTSFNTKVLNSKVNKMNIEIEFEVKNEGEYPGKEVIQFYLTKPNEKLDEPYVELCSYYKTKELLPNQIEKAKVIINLLDFASYDSSRAVNVLTKGDYIIRIGNSSENNKAILIANLGSELIIEQLENKCISKEIISSLTSKREKENLQNIPLYHLDASEIKTRVVKYQKDTYVDSLIKELNNETLALICLGHHLSGFSGIVGSSCKHVVGGAGETVLSVPSIKNFLTMADGPAGIRIKQEYGIDKKGIFDTCLDPMMEKMLDYLPKISGIFIKPNPNRKGKIYHQYTTAIPVGTALAQSFNPNFVKKCGEIVREEMEIFNIDLWLAPALNIHRNILCGRNFEYYSEDPYLSGTIAIAMINGVEKNNKGVTLKHFAFNNQEFNRTNNNSHIDERVARQIYLKAFEMAIKKANPKAIMTSYNLINGQHTSESYELINDILRCEWNYEGLIMTDWVASGRSFCKASKYPSCYASNNILAGNDLTMPGCNKDYKDILKALKEGKITREDLLNSASRIYRCIEAQKNIKKI